MSGAPDFNLLDANGSPVGLSGYRSGVAFVDKKRIVAVGTNGADLTIDGGETWKKVGSDNFNSVAAKGKNSVWAVGPKGGVYRYEGLMKTDTIE